MNLKFSHCGWERTGRCRGAAGVKFSGADGGRHGGGERVG
jgi:hypothetical protein